MRGVSLKLVKASPPLRIELTNVLSREYKLWLIRNFNISVCLLYLNKIFSFDATIQLSFANIDILNVAFKSGWSKFGNT